MHFLHTASRRIIDLLVEEGIGTLVIGKNPFWKQAVEIGHKHNQEFVQIPHAKFIELLTYKAERVGVTVLVTENPIPAVPASWIAIRSLHTTRSWGRNRSTIRASLVAGMAVGTASKGVLPSTPMSTASYNIGRKVFPTAFEGRGIEATAVRPRRLAV